jgi:hypothetical protein
MLLRVVLYKFTGVLEVLTASIMKVMKSINEY